MKQQSFLLALGVCMLLTGSASAAQPVMNEAPRWAGGWGFQVRNLHRESDALILKDKEIANPFGKKRRVNRTMLEGVYTWDRSKRITVKIPYIDQMRVTEVNGRAVRQEDRGLGDIVVGTPLRKYTNYKEWTSNISFTPSIRIPSGETGGDYPISDGSTDVGISLSYGAESPKYLLGVGASYWINNEGKRGQKEGDELDIDIILGRNMFHNSKKSSAVSFQLEFQWHHKESGFLLSGNNEGDRITVGPAVAYFRGNAIVRAVYSLPVYERYSQESVSYGHQFDIGIGWVF